MRVEIVGKNGFNPSEANRSYVIAKLEKLNNFFSSTVNLEARVVCKVYKGMQKVEITIPAKNLIMRAEVEEVDLYAAIDKAIDKLISQVRNHKEKVKNNFEKEGIKTVFREGFEKENQVKTEKRDIVREKNIELLPMTKDDAIHQMELLGHDFFLYLDDETLKVNVVYVRKDGHYAVLKAK